MELSVNIYDMSEGHSDYCDSTLVLIIDKILRCAVCGAFIQPIMARMDLVLPKGYGPAKLEIPEPAAIPAPPEIKIPSWLKIAQGQIGVKEFAGDGHNPAILDYFLATSYHATTDETPWCSAFVNWVMSKADYDVTKSAAARSWVRGPSEQYTDIWLVKHENDAPRAPLFQLGDIVVLRNKGDKKLNADSEGSLDARSGRGHVAFFDSLVGSENKILCLGGNQSNSVMLTSFSIEDVVAIVRPSVKA